MNTHVCHKILLCLALATTACTTRSLAEETGSGHYAPGAMASIIDTLPTKPGLAVANYFMYYDGNASANPVQFAGLTALDAHARAYSDSLLIMYDTKLELLGANYVPAVAIPYVWLKVDGKVTDSQGVTTNLRDTANGIGDMTLYPMMLAWHKGDFKYDLRFGLYAPTGDYEEFRLANIGKNYWTFEPAGSISWFSSKFGLEATAFAGFDISTKNNTTDYQSGDVFHFDATVAEHLPVGKLGIVGVGANAFVYQQVTGDCGSGALLGGFEGRTVGVGPVVSLLTKIGHCSVAAEVKWLPEVDTEKRLKGDYIWFKLGVVF